MSFDSSVPGSIGKRNFALVWFVTEINGTPVEDTYITDTGFHVYYTLLAAPQSPMSEPWTEVLDYACVWASGKNSESGAVKKITEKTYTELDKTYDGSRTHADYPSFNLTNFFAQNWADCRDMSAVVQVFSNAIGGANTKVRKISGYGDPQEEPGFYTKDIIPIGESDWRTTWWLFHQVGWRSNVYDACIKLDNSFVRIPTNESINGTYKDDLLYDGVWNPLNPARYTTVY